MDRDLDLLVIGAGIAGTTAATKCAGRGWRVAIADALPYGGTCALRGCDPKKILRRAAEVIDDAHLMRDKGIDPGDIRINWPDLMRRKREFTTRTAQSIESSLGRAGVTTMHAAAAFADETHVRIDGQVLAPRHVLVATGARPRALDFPGHDHLVDSTAFLDLDSLPARILFVGGGYVSFELAHIAARTGSATVIVDRGARLLKGFDPDLVDLLVERGHGAGVDVRAETTVTAVEVTARGYAVTVEHAGRAETLETDLVVHGAGRVPDLDHLGLEAGHVARTARGVTVAAHLQSTSNHAVYAAGDAADTRGMPLTPVAVAEGKVAASNLLAEESGHDPAVPDYDGIPTAAFTIPELVRVGLLEHEARQQGRNVDVRYHDTSTWYSAYRVGETVGAAKVLVDRDTDRIIGAHLLGHDCAELIAIFGLAIRLGLTAHQLRSTPAAYPTLGSDLAALL